RVPVNVEAAEGEGDAAGDRVAVVRRGIQGLRPVRLRWIDTRCPAVLDRRVERHVDDRRVEGVDGGTECVGIDAEPRGELLQAVGRGSGDGLRVVLLR